MKKFLTLLLATIMCVSLCACGENTVTGKSDEEKNQTTENAYAEVEEALLGDWGHCRIFYADSEHSTIDLDYSMVIVYQFREDGNCTKMSYKLYSDGRVKEGFSYSGTYEIKENEIIYKKTDGDGEQAFEYTFEDGTLHIYEHTPRLGTLEYFHDNWLEGVIEEMREDGFSALEQYNNNYISYFDNE